MRLRTPRRRTRLLRVIPYLLLAVLLHLLGWLVADPWLPGKSSFDHRPDPISVVFYEPPADEETDEDEDEERPDLDGQIVETAPPEEQERPDDTRYLAEHDRVVEEETRSERFEINPEVLADEYSEEQAEQMEESPEVAEDTPSEGATTGNERFNPDRDGTLASLPAPRQLSSREGTADPFSAQSADAMLQGAPSNDMLDEQRARQTHLNTKEYLYASYLNRIRQLVNHYWQENINNLPRTVRLSRPQYSTRVNAILDANGALQFIEVTGESGSPELDDCVVRAFRIAGPFPNPPEGLIERDGRVYLPDMSFTVVLQQATMQYQGVDPRAGVQFPGLLKSPR